MSINKEDGVCLSLDKMKIAIVAVLVCISLCVSGQERPRPRPPGPPGPPGPRPRPPHPRKGPATTQEINQLIGNALRRLSEKERDRILLNSTLVQTDSLNVTVDIKRGEQLFGRTKRLAPSVTRTNSSLEISLEMDQEDYAIRGIAVIKGTVNGTEVEKSGKISIVLALAALTGSLKADLTRESVTITDISVGNTPSAAEVTISGTDLEDSDLVTIKQAIADDIATVIAEGVNTFEANKEKAIEGLNKLTEGKNLEEILDKLERRRPGPPGPRPGPHGPEFENFLALFSL